MPDLPPLAASNYLIAPASAWPVLWEQLTEGVHPSDRWSPEDWSKSLALKDVRTVQAFASQQAVGAGRMVALPQADQMSREVANALLKLLEEPPPGLTVVLLGETDRVLATVRSRVQTQIVPSEALSEQRLLRVYRQLNAQKNPEQVRQFLYWAPLFHATLQTDTVLDAFQLPS